MSTPNVPIMNVPIIEDPVDSTSQSSMEAKMYSQRVVQPAASDDTNAMATIHEGNTIPYNTVAVSFALAPVAVSLGEQIVLNLAHYLPEGITSLALNSITGAAENIFFHGGAASFAVIGHEVGLYEFNFSGLNNNTGVQYNLKLPINITPTTEAATHVIPVQGAVSYIPVFQPPEAATSTATPTLSALATAANVILPIETGQGTSTSGSGGGGVTNPNLQSVDITGTQFTLTGTENNPLALKSIVTGISQFINQFDSGGGGGPIRGFAPIRGGGGGGGSSHEITSFTASEYDLSGALPQGVSISGGTLVDGGWTFTPQSLENAILMSPAGTSFDLTLTTTGTALVQGDFSSGGGGGGRFGTAAIGGGGGTSGSGSENFTTPTEVALTITTNVVVEVAFPFNTLSESGAVNTQIPIDLNTAINNALTGSIFLHSRSPDFPTGGSTESVSSVTLGNLTSTMQVMVNGQVVPITFDNNGIGTVVLDRSNVGSFGPNDILTISNSSAGTVSNITVNVFGQDVFSGTPWAVNGSISLQTAATTETGNFSTNLTVDQNANIALPVGAQISAVLSNFAGTDLSQISSVTISGLPSGFVLEFGSSSLQYEVRGGGGSGSVVLYESNFASPADFAAALNSLILSPTAANAFDLPGVLPISITALGLDSHSNAGLSITGDFAVTVNQVIENFTSPTTSVSGAEQSGIPISLASFLAGGLTDALSQNIGAINTITISGLPVGAIFTPVDFGGNAAPITVPANGTIELIVGGNINTVFALDSSTLNSNAPGIYSLSITATGTDGNLEVMNITGTIQLTVDAVPQNLTFTTFVSEGFINHDIGIGTELSAALSQALASGTATNNLAELSSISFNGLPVGSILDIGGVDYTANNGTVLVQASDFASSTAFVNALSSVSINSSISGNIFNVSISATGTDTFSEPINITGSLQLTVNDPLALGFGSPTSNGPQNTNVVVPLAIGLSNAISSANDGADPNDFSGLTSITLNGLPPGGILEVGGINYFVPGTGTVVINESNFSTPSAFTSALNNINLISSESNFFIVNVTATGSDSAQTSINITGDLALGILPQSENFNFTSLTTIGEQSHDITFPIATGLSTALSGAVNDILAILSTVTISDLPAGTILNVGGVIYTASASGEIVISSSDFASNGIFATALNSVTVNSPSPDSFSAVISAQGLDNNAESVNVDGFINVTITPSTETNYGFDSATYTGSQNANIVLPLNTLLSGATNSDGTPLTISDLFSVEIRGLPNGATLEAIDNNTGVVTTINVANGLSAPITPDLIQNDTIYLNSSTPNGVSSPELLQITASGIDSSGSSISLSGSINVVVNQVFEPTYSFGAASVNGIQNTNIALPLTTIFNGLTNSSGEVLNINELSGVQISGFTDGSFFLAVDNTTGVQTLIPSTTGFALITAAELENSTIYFSTPTVSTTSPEVLTVSGIGTDSSNLQGIVVQGDINVIVGADPRFGFAPDTITGAQNSNIALPVSTLLNGLQDGSGHTLNFNEISFLQISDIPANTIITSVAGGVVTPIPVVDGVATITGAALNGVIYFNSESIGSAPLTIQVLGTDPSISELVSAFGVITVDVTAPTDHHTHLAHAHAFAIDPALTHVLASDPTLAGSIAHINLNVNDALPAWNTEHNGAHTHLVHYLHTLVSSGNLTPSTLATVEDLLTIIQNNDGRHAGHHVGEHIPNPIGDHGHSAAQNVPVSMDLVANELHTTAHDAAVHELHSLNPNMSIQAIEQALARASAQGSSDAKGHHLHDAAHIGDWTKVVSGTGSASGAAAASQATGHPGGHGHTGAAGPHGSVLHEPAANSTAHPVHHELPLPPVDHHIKH